MRLQFGLPLLALTLLTACAPTLGSSDAARIKTLAPLLSGTYEGSGKASLFKNKYRILLNIDPRTGRADAVVTNTDLNKVYPASGTFIPYNDQGGSLEMKLYEGKRDSGMLKLRLMADKDIINAEGSLKAFLLTYQLTLHKLSVAQAKGLAVPVQPQPAAQLFIPSPSGVVPLSGAVTTNAIPQPPTGVGSAGATYTITTGPATSQPVYVTPTPGPLPQ